MPEKNRKSWNPKGILSLSPGLLSAAMTLGIPALEGPVLWGNLTRTYMPLSSCKKFLQKNGNVLVKGLPPGQEPSRNEH